MARVKLKLQDQTPARVIFIETEATIGATIGTDLRLPGGKIGTVAELKAFFASDGGGITAHRLLAGLALGDDHPQYTRRDILTADGDLYTRAGGIIVRKPIGTSRQALRTIAGAPTWTSGDALTRVNDTNVTLTLGGTPATALSEAVSLTLGWTGLLDPTRGGTGFGTYVIGDMLYANSTTSLAKRAIGSANDVMRVAAGVPAWVASGALTRTNDTNITITLGGAPTNALLDAVSITVGWSGTLAPTRGGTGIGTYTTGDLLYASATNVLSKLAVGTNTHVLTLAGGVPTWAAPAAGGTPAGSTGYIQFNNAGAFGADITLFWDNTNKRLGRGTAIPSYEIHNVNTANANATICTANGSNGNAAFARFLAIADGGNGMIGATSSAYTGITDGDNTFMLNTSQSKGIGFSFNGVLLAKVDFTGHVLGAFGNGALPGFGFYGDENTGMYRAGADIVGISTGGTEALRISGGATAGKSLISVRSAGAAAGYFGLSGAWEGDSSVDTAVIAESGNQIRFYTNGSATEVLTLTTGGRAQGVAGSAALPTFSFMGDPNTGVFNNGADILALVAGGVTQMNLGTTFIGAEQPVTFQFGTLATPGINFAANHGIYRISATQIGVITSGSATPVGFITNGAATLINFAAVTLTGGTGGTASALPALPVGYLRVQIGGVNALIPYYS